jgi:hypothetical protein
MSNARPLPVVPKLGDFGVVPTYPTGRDALLSWAIRYGTNAPVNHAFVYVGHGMIVEAQPGGARTVPADRYHTVAWSTGKIPLTDTQRSAIAAAAVGFADRHVGYGWLDIVAIALAQRRTFGLVHARAPLAEQPWWVQRIERMDRLICSQLVDLAYADAGVQLFDDGRIPGLVSPGDLWRLIGSPALVTA